jgi:hypothetical protein
MNKPINNNPNAKVLINSMRSIGYDFSSAIADIIDNSLAAKSKNINILFPISELEGLYLEIVDDGYGMERDEIFEAMKFGTLKTNARESNDLGRFGLGLKTASISQCRKFTVISKKNSNVSGFQWDLDEIVDENWTMFELLPENISKIKNIDNFLHLETFTLILWEKIDSLDSEINLHNDEISVFLNKIEKAKIHVSLTFHRFIEEGTIIKFNGDKLSPKDPFLRSHNKTLIKPIQTIATKTKAKNDESITFQVFILPFHKDLSDKDYDLIGGKEMIHDQGFYVYRNRRLMVKGTWFKLQNRNVLFENARIKVDIPNTLDDLWSIDVKKQQAVIPSSIINQLGKEIIGARERARQINLYKGKKQVEDESIWNKFVDERQNQVRYFVNLKSSSIQHLINKLEDAEKTTFFEILKLIELTLPYQDIYNSVASKNNINPPSEEDLNIILGQAMTLFAFLKKTINKSNKDLIEMICNWEPYFSANIKSLLLDKYN